MAWYLSTVNGRRTAAQIAHEYGLPLNVVEERIEQARLRLEKRAQMVRTRRIARICSLYSA